MLVRRVCQVTSLPGRPSLASETSGRMEISGRLFQEMRRPTSWVTRWFLVALMWQVAQVGRGGVVLAHDPLGVVQVHLVHVGAEGDAVLGLVVDLDLRMVRPHVALAAGVGGAGLGGGELVAAVAGGAGAFAAVGIDAADAGVGPGGGVGLAVGQDLDLARRGTASSR